MEALTLVSSQLIKFFFTPNSFLFRQETLLIPTVSVWHSDCCTILLQVNYKSDLNWIRGVGWTPPGSHKAELARRAAELGLAEGVSTEEAIAKYQHMMMVREHGR